jgi:hypothetical protein
MTSDELTAARNRLVAQQMDRLAELLSASTASDPSKLSREYDAWNAAVRAELAGDGPLFRKVAP